MFRFLIAFSLQRPGLVLLLGCLLLLGALYEIPRLPIDVFPELNAPTVVVMTEAPGLAADEVEQTVTFPLETAVNGLPGLRGVRSASSTGLSILWVEFAWGQDIHRARMLVGERLASARNSLPRQARAEMTPITSITGEVMLLALSSPTGQLSPMEVRSYAEFELRNLLLAVPGIAQVVAIGGELPEYQVLVRQQQLQLHDLRIGDIIEAARGAHSTAGAGYLSNVGGLELPVRQTGRVQDSSDIANTLVRSRDGNAITIGQVAEVGLGPAPRRGTAADKGVPAVVLSVQKSPGINTLELTAAIDRKLDQIEAAMPAGLQLNRHVMRQTDFIGAAVDNLLRVLRDAALFVIVVLVLFLLNLRTTLITLAALPLSLAAALLVLGQLGMSINVMTLGGLAVAIGGLVDDAIIDVENVFRALRQNAQKPAAERLPTTQVVELASNQIRSPMVFATVVIVMVFVPLLFLEGLEGRFFRPLGIAYIISTLASLVVALTVTPAMCSLLLGGVKGGGEHGEGPVVRWLQRAYAPALGVALRRARSVLLACAAATLASLGLLSTYGTSFLPEFHEGSFTVFLMAPPGTSLEESDRIANGIERRLAAIPGVRSVVRRTGRAERDEHAEPPSHSEIDVGLLPAAEKRAVKTAIDAVLAMVPGITTSVGQPIEHRLSHVLSGTPAALAIDIQGDDLAQLRELAKAVEAVLRAVPGTRDVAANREIMVTSLPVRYRPADLAAAGLSPAAAATQVEQALMGETVAEVAQGSRRYGLTVRLHPDERQQVDDVRRLLLHGSQGALVRLHEVADVGLERTSNLIARSNTRRKATVSCNVAEGYNLGQLVAAVRERVEPIVYEAGCTVHFGGQFEAQQSASRSILWMSGIVLVAMLVLLQMATRSFAAALLVMLNLPLALIGGIAAIYLTGTGSALSNSLALFGLGSQRYEAPVVSIASLVGFVTLFGIAVRNGILLVRHYFDLIEEGLPCRDAVLRGSRERLVPILMTALSAALGLLPLAWAAGEPGSEILAPLAVVVLGGLLSSTFLNALVVPAGFYLLFRNQPHQPPTAGSR